MNSLGFFKVMEKAEFGTSVPFRRNQKVRNSSVKS